MNTHLSIILPCYNEAKNIPLILLRFAEVIKRSDLELILVNNGSTDESNKVLMDLLPQYPFARMVDVPVNKGYGYGIMCGLRASQGEFLAWTHADMQTDPNDVIKALTLAEKSAMPARTFVKGYRTGRPLSDIVFTIAMSGFESIYLGVPLNNINSQPNLFHRTFFESWENPPDDFALDLYVYYLARKQKLKVLRFPVLFPERIHGHSHWNINWQAKVKFIKRTIEFSTKLKRSLFLHD